MEPIEIRGGGGIMTKLKDWWEKRQAAKKLEKEISSLRKISENLHHKEVNY